MKEGDVNRKEKARLKERNRGKRMRQKYGMRV
jgi:hypothetical protein